MPDQGYIVYLPDHCVIPVAYDMTGSHYKTIHKATAQPPIGAYTNRYGGGNMMPEKESSLHGGAKLRSTCTEEESLSYSAAFDPVTLHPYEDIAQVNHGRESCYSSISNTYTSLGPEKARAIAIEIENCPSSCPTQVMVDPWARLYLRWILAESGYWTALVDTGSSPTKEMWNNQWLVVEWDSVRPRARETIDSTLRVFRRCASFREVAQLASEITSEGTLEFTGLEKFEAPKKEKSEAVIALEKVHPHAHPHPHPHVRAHPAYTPAYAPAYTFAYTSRKIHNQILSAPPHPSVCEKAIDEVINPWDGWDDDW